MGRRVMWINPAGSGEFNEEAARILGSSQSPGTTVSVTSLSRGPRYLGFRYYKALVLVDTLHEIRRAERDQYDAAIIGCFGDPGVPEAREISDRLIVVGPGEASMRIASSLSDAFSIVVGSDSWIRGFGEEVDRYGLRGHLASFIPLGVDTLRFREQPVAMAEKLFEVGRKALDRDHCGVIVLGCTFLSSYQPELQTRLGVPVIDPVRAGLAYAEFLIDLARGRRWSWSKIGGKTPPLREIREWQIERDYGCEGLWQESDRVPRGREPTCG
jgi:allantoin racemase